MLSRRRCLDARRREAEIIRLAKEPNGRGRGTSARLTHWSISTGGRYLTKGEIAARDASEAPGPAAEAPPVDAAAAPAPAAEAPVPGAAAPPGFVPAVVLDAPAPGDILPTPSPNKI